MVKAQDAEAGVCKLVGNREEHGQNGVGRIAIGQGQ